MITEVGFVEIDVPRDRYGTSEPKTVKKRQLQPQGIDSMVISLTTMGLTTGQVQAHVAELYGTAATRQSMSKIADAVLVSLFEILAAAASWKAKASVASHPRTGDVGHRPI